MASEVYKALFNIIETTQILFGPCDMDRGRYYVTRKTLEGFMGSTERIQIALQNIDNVVELYPDD